MTEGSVDDRLDAILPVQLLDGLNQLVTLEAVVDTGFSGFLILSSEVITKLGLTRLGASEAQLGNGEIVQFAVFTANVVWHGRQRVIVGMSLLKNSRLTIDVITGGKVSIAPLTSSS